jgi:hypothetical protein
VAITKLHLHDGKHTNFGLLWLSTLALVGSVVPYNIRFPSGAGYDDSFVTPLPMEGVERRIGGSSSAKKHTTNNDGFASVVKT